MVATHCHLACFQETKLAAVDGPLAAFLSGYQHNCFTHKPAHGTRGGTLLVWNDSYIDLRDIVIRRFSVMATVSIKDCGTNFSLTVVYGPTRDNRKQAFLQKLRNSKPIDDVGWLLLGDINLIYQARDKNNRNLNLRRMWQFRGTLSSCELKEIYLQNRKFTWSNGRRNPTLVRLDRVFCNEHWDLTFERHGLQALATGLSDHCPLMLSSLAGPRQPRPFRFENLWTKIPGFLDEVRAVWQRPSPHTQPIRILHHKLSSTARHLCKWCQSILSDAKKKFFMALEVIKRSTLLKNTGPSPMLSTSLGKV
jgi:exonuclease III